MMYFDIFFGENVDVNESKKAEVGIDTSIFFDNLDHFELFEF